MWLKAYKSKEGNKGSVVARAMLCCHYVLVGHQLRILTKQSTNKKVNDSPALFRARVLRVFEGTEHYIMTFMIRSIVLSSQ
jgi:hypothetical protein